MRWLVVLSALVIPGCGDTLDDRLSELDARATVDCGSVDECDSPGHANAVATCLGDSLAAGIGAKALLEVGIDWVTYVYALDGAYVKIEGVQDDGPNFTEFTCSSLETSGSSLCYGAHATDCEEVREWND